MYKKQSLLVIACLFFLSPIKTKSSHAPTPETQETLVTPAIATTTLPSLPTAPAPVQALTPAPLTPLDISVSAPAEQKRLVKVIVDIPKEQQSYSYFLGTYKPTSFYLTLNGIKTETDQTPDISIIDNKIAIIYYAQFENGRESSKKYNYSIDPSTKTVTVTFNWKDKPRIQLDDNNAVCESVEDLI